MTITSKIEKKNCYLCAVLQSRLANTWRGAVPLPQIWAPRGRLVWGSWPFQMAALLLISEDLMICFSGKLWSFLVLGSAPSMKPPRSFKKIHIYLSSPIQHTSAAHQRQGRRRWTGALWRQKGLEEIVPRMAVFYVTLGMYCPTVNKTLTFT